MPRYHFHVEDGHLVPDPEGTELPDIKAAREEAARLAGRLLQDNAAEFWDTAGWQVRVTDAGGGELFVLAVTVSEAAKQPAYN